MSKNQNNGDAPLFLYTTVQRVHRKLFIKDCFKKILDENIQEKIFEKNLQKKERKSKSLNM